MKINENMKASDLSADGGLVQNSGSNKLIHYRIVSKLVQLVASYDALSSFLTTGNRFLRGSYFPAWHFGTALKGVSHFFI